MAPVWGDQAATTKADFPPGAPPIECLYRFRLELSAEVTFHALQDGQTSPLLAVTVSHRTRNRLTINALASGQKMATTAVSSRRWKERFENTGVSQYGWQFEQVRNLWDDRDRAEIGADYAALTPFDEKLFVLRLVILPESRQVWIDDRLVAEHRIRSAGPVQFVALGSKTKPGASALSQSVSAADQYERYLPLRLDDYQSDGQSRPAGGVTLQQVWNDQTVPIRTLGKGADDLDLGRSLWRYRLSFGSGPDVPYVNGQSGWPTPLLVDPARASFRIPYRDYQTAWLIAWVDEKPGCLARGSIAFFREHAGYIARSDFEVSDDAIRRKLVKPLGENDKGKQLYLIRVPLDTNGLYGFTDMSSQFLDFQISKPLHWMRSYPDSIYYSQHPAGEPSSLHVASITLEAAPFSYRVKPAQYGHVFEQPETPAYSVAVTNHSAATIQATVRLDTTSYDGRERAQAQTSQAVSVAAGTTVDVPLSLQLNLLGWHELKATVSTDNATRSATSSLILLPPNTRTYGNAPNETRFGSWPLMAHYVPISADRTANEPVLAMLRKLGIRRIDFHPGYIIPEMARKYDLLPVGPHTTMSHFRRLNVDDPVQMEAMRQGEVKMMEPLLKQWPNPIYYYGGEWAFDHIYSHAPNPDYTGQPPYIFSSEAEANLKRQLKIFEEAGRAIRQHAPGVKLALQWGSPLHNIAFMEAGFPKDLVDYFGMDAPMFELTPEIPLAVGSINYLWTVRAEAKRLGWPRLPIAWCEGPFMPAWPGALTLQAQEQNHVRYWLLGLAYGVEAFEAGVVPFDASNYYGAEHYGAGVFYGIPRECPKPAAAALATATKMLCGTDVVGPVETGMLTSYCLALKNAKTGKMIYALWRVAGTAEATVSAAGSGPAVVTEAMGNAHDVPVNNGKLTITLSPSPIWLTGISEIQGFTFGTASYQQKPAAVSRPLPVLTAENWTYSGEAVVSYEENHYGLVRVADPELTATFGISEASRPVAAAITLATQPEGDRPLAIRYGSLVPKEPVLIPGKANALGFWVKGNSGWGRVAFEVRDAKGELWTSIGTAKQWNCDDVHGWSRIGFEGWRYLRFPLPGNHPYDAAREVETTWWDAKQGDGIVDLPLRLERVFVEASNDVLYLGMMKRVPERTYLLAGLSAEYASEADAGDAVLARYQYRPVPSWEGPMDNPIVRLLAEGVGDPPAIKGFEPPHHFNDGRQMFIRFEQHAGLTYNLCVSRFPDGRGAERLAGVFKDQTLVKGLRPGVPVYLFLTSTDTRGQESKPSAAFRLLTEDRFAEK